MLNFVLGDKTQFLGGIGNRAAQFFVAHSVKLTRLAALGSLHTLARQHAEFFQRANSGIELPRNIACL